MYPTSLIVFALLSIHLLQLVSSQDTYHIKPTLQSPCDFENCYTLSEFVDDTGKNRSLRMNNITLLFLPGVHVLEVGVLFSEYPENMALLGDSSSMPIITSTIICLDTVGIVFVRTSEVRIEKLAFVNCGDTTISGGLPVLTMSSVRYSFIGNCKMEHNGNTLFSHYSIVHVHNSTFVTNTGQEGGAMRVVGGSVKFTGLNRFQGNLADLGAGIYVREGEVHFKGPTEFISNGAASGGAIYACKSRVVFDNLADVETTAHSCFFENSAAYEGGAVALENSTLVQRSYHSLEFIANSIEDSGGAVWGDHSTFIMEGTSTFKNNTARVGFGGAVYLGSNCTWNSSILMATSNTASGGGAIYSNISLLHFKDSTIFLYNSATEYSGGGTFLAASEVTFYGNVTFCHNLALRGGGFPYATTTTFLPTREGGALYAEHRTTIKFLSKSIGTFINNSAESGGAVACYSCYLQFSGSTTFTGNFASAGEGGGIHAYVEARLCFLGIAVFTNNTAVSGGGISASFNCIVQFNTTAKTVFSGNIAEQYGGWLDIWTECYLVFIGQLKLLNNKAGIAGGAINIWKGNSYMILAGQGQFVNNSAIFGGAIAIDQSGTQLRGNYSFEDNSANYGAAVFTNRGDIRLKGNHTFVRNVARHNGYGGYGGGVHALKTRIVFQGKVTFTGNSASYGGGLAIADYEHAERRLLFLKPNSMVQFIRNYARVHGGGLLVQGATFLYCPTYSHVTLALAMPCFFQLQEDPMCTPDTVQHLTNESSYYSVNVVFEANFAEEGGSDVFGGILDKCGVCVGNRSYYTLGSKTLSQLVGNSLQQTTGKPSNISSDPFRVCLCDNLQANCNITQTSWSVAPGQTIRTAAVATGQLNGTSPAVVHATFTSYEEGNIDQLQNTQPVAMTCTPLEYTFTKRDKSEANLTLYAGVCGELGYSVTILVVFLPCPSGFALQSGGCICEHRLQKYTNSCDINSRTITRNSRFWVGYDRQSHGLILHPHCPFDYCALETVSFPLNSTDQQCAHGRSGTLCGACKSGLSLTLGTSRCSSCSNTFVFLLLPFAAAGFLLVVFLFTCKLTVSAGTTSGLIFYANVVAVNRSVFVPPGETNVLTVFIAWLNLDLGIEICFYDGMDTYTKTWLQFVFPLYIWSLVGLISMASHYSMTVARIIGPANPVAVLATLFLLSYTKLLRTIIATFSFTTLDYPDDHKLPVWAYDGNIRFCEGKHAALFVAGLMAFLFVFLPYTLLLLCGQFIIARSNYRVLSWANRRTCKAFLDAYYAPYKNGYRYWTGLLLVLRLILFTISAVVDINTPKDPSINLLVLVVACIGLAVLSWNTGSMYKKWYCNALESSFILNLAILAAASYQVKVETGSQRGVFYTSVGVAFLTFLGIIASHVIEQVSDTRAWKYSIRPVFVNLKARVDEHESNEDAIEMDLPPVSPPSKVATTFVELREPLLESKN